MKKESWLDNISVEEAQMLADRFLDEEYTIVKKEDPKYGKYFEFTGSENNTPVLLGEYGDLQQRKQNNGVELYNTFDGIMDYSKDKLTLGYIFPKKWITYIAIQNHGRKIGDMTYSDAYNLNAQIRIKELKEAEIQQAENTAQKRSAYMRIVSENLATKKSTKDPAMGL